MTRFARIIPVAFGLVAVCAFAQQPDSQTPARGKRIVIAASALLDGKGRSVAQHSHRDRGRKDRRY